MSASTSTDLAATLDPRQAATIAFSTSLSTAMDTLQTTRQSLNNLIEADTKLSETVFGLNSSVGQSLDQTINTEVEKLRGQVDALLTASTQAGTSWKGLASVTTAGWVLMSSR
jgi:ABC-type transporter Mla subunit MlaD